MTTDPQSRNDAPLDEQVPEFLDEDEDARAGDEVAVEAAPGKPGGPLRFARMAGSSIAARDAAAVDHRLPQRRVLPPPGDEREVDDLRLAFSVLTTYWYRKALRAPAARHRPARVPPRLRHPTASTPRARRAAR